MTTFLYGHSLESYGHFKTITQKLSYRKTNFDLLCFWHGADIWYIFSRIVIVKSPDQWSWLDQDRDWCILNFYKFYRCKCALRMTRKIFVCTSRGLTMSLSFWCFWAILSVFCYFFKRNRQKLPEDCLKMTLFKKSVGNKCLKK